MLVIIKRLFFPRSAASSRLRSRRISGCWSLPFESIWWLLDDCRSEWWSTQRPCWKIRNCTLWMLNYDQLRNRSHPVLRHARVSEVFRFPSIPFFATCGWCVCVQAFGHVTEKIKCIRHIQHPSISAPYLDKKHHREWWNQREIKLAFVWSNFQTACF